MSVSVGILLSLLILFYLWIYSIFYPLRSVSELPILRARLGTIFWHSSDENGIYRASYRDPQAVDHIYCYYPKSQVNFGLLLVRKDNGDCSDFLGEMVIHESPWVSERQKYWYPLKTGAI